MGPSVSQELLCLQRDEQDETAEDGDGLRASTRSEVRVCSDGAAPCSGRDGKYCGTPVCVCVRVCALLDLNLFTQPHCRDLFSS